MTFRLELRLSIQRKNTDESIGIPGLCEPEPKSSVHLEQGCRAYKVFSFLAAKNEVGIIPVSSYLKIPGKNIIFENYVPSEAGPENFRRELEN